MGVLVVAIIALSAYLLGVLSVGAAAFGHIHALKSRLQEAEDRCRLAAQEREQMVTGAFEAVRARARAAQAERRAE